MTAKKVWTVEEAAQVLDRYDSSWFTRITKPIVCGAASSCIIGQSFGYCNADKIYQLFGSSTRFDPVHGPLDTDIFSSNRNNTAWEEAVKWRKEGKHVAAIELPENRTQPVLDGTLKEIAKDICAGNPDKARELLVMMGYIKHIPEQFVAVSDADGLE